MKANSQPLLERASGGATGSLTVSQAVELIRSQGEFDAHYYIATYKSLDPIIKLVDPISHYLLIGHNRGFQPSRWFNSKEYAAKHPQLAGSSVNPLLHFCLTRSKDKPEGSRHYHPIPLTYCRKTTTAHGSRAPLSRKRHKVQQLDSVSLDVIIPVYEGREETLETITSVLASRNKTTYELIVINDSSPNKRLTQELERLATHGLITYLKNARNMGFARTVNRGLSLHPTRNVLLLNSDTLVTGNWIDRIVHHATDGVATVTPFSNNASLCSYPKIFEVNELPSRTSVRTLDRLCSRLNKGQSLEVPTGVGFCMYIAREAIDAVGLIDTECFSAGYGEDNDFCLRAHLAGLRNLQALDVFVYHAGGVSFRSKGISSGGAKSESLYAKYPTLRGDLRSFAVRDPSLHARQLLDLALVMPRARKNITIYLAEEKDGVVGEIRNKQKKRRVKAAPFLFIREPGNRTVYLKSLRRDIEAPNLKGLTADRLKTLLTAVAARIQELDVRVEQTDKRHLHFDREFERVCKELGYKFRYHRRSIR